MRPIPQASTVADQANNFIIPFGIDASDSEGSVFSRWFSRPQKPEDAEVEVHLMLVNFIFLCICINVLVYGKDLFELLNWSNTTPRPKAPSGASSSADGNRLYRSIAFRYLPAFWLGTFADWMTGPYVYALYEDYGYSVDQIGNLFIAGFGSSLIFGTWLGAMADKHGRKQSCLLYCMIMALACACKNSRRYPVLILGRVCGGIATSLLYSAFEAWVGCELNVNGLQSELPKLFSVATFGNAFGAVVAGFIANGLAEQRGYTAPFNGAIPALISCFVVVAAGWNENYGSSSSSATEGGGDAGAGDDAIDLSQLTTPDRKRLGIGHESPESIALLSNQKSGTSNNATRLSPRARLAISNSRAPSFVETARDILNEPSTLTVGLISALFEASLYIFVFVWTPSLQSQVQGQSVPLGRVFALYMVAKMAGTGFVRIMSALLTLELTAQLVLLCAAVSLTIPVYAQSFRTTLFGQAMFEFCVGMYWPIIMSLRGKYVKENARSTTFNLFRVPLNAMVVAALIWVEDMSHTTIYKICAIAMCVACLLARNLYNRHRRVLQPRDRTVNVAHLNRDSPSPPRPNFQPTF